MRTALTMLLLLFTISTFSQTRSAVISGRIVDENDNPILAHHGDVRRHRVEDRLAESVVVDELIHRVVPPM